MRNVSKLLLAASVLAACFAPAALAEPPKAGAAAGDAVGVHKFSPEHVIRLDRDFAREQLILNDHEDKATKEMKPYADDIEEVYKLYHIDMQLIRAGLVTIDLKAGTFTISKPPAPSTPPPAQQPPQQPAAEKKEKSK